MESYLKSRKPIVLVPYQPAASSTDNKTQTNTPPGPPPEPIVIGPLNTNICSWDQILNKRKKL
jgi:hypothetical protein